MSSKSGVEWTRTYHADGSYTSGSSWSPITGCTKKSDGCANCYAKREVETRWSKNPRSVFYGRKFSDIQCHPEQLGQVLRWRKGRKIFVCPRADLFHEAVPDEFIDQVFAVMALAKQHTFQVLTKRPERMLKYLTTPTDSGITSVRVGLEALSICLHSKIKNNASEIGKGVLLQASDINPGAPKNWPLPNVWMGVTVENQETADERIPLLLQTPAAVRWVSMEPLLGPVDLGYVFGTGSGSCPMHLAGVAPEGLLPKGEHHLHWVVVGGESGPNARPMHPDWARSLRDQCNAAGVPFLFKQWGVFAPWEQLVATTAALRARAKEYVFTDGAKVERFGKRLTGRALDGYEYTGYPEAQP